MQINFICLYMPLWVGPWALKLLTDSPMGAHGPIGYLIIYNLLKFTVRNIFSASSTGSKLKFGSRKSSLPYLKSPSCILISNAFNNIVFLYALFLHVDNANIFYVPLVQICFNTQLNFFAFVQIYSQVNKGYTYFQSRAYFIRLLYIPYLRQVTNLRVLNSGETRYSSIIIKTAICHILLERFFSPTNLTCNFG